MNERAASSTFTKCIEEQGNYIHVISFFVVAAVPLADWRQSQLYPPFRLAGNLISITNELI